MTMTKKLVLIGVLVLLALMAPATFAGGGSKVAYTWTLTDLGQGIGGGGPLFADGRTGGNLSFVDDNGQLVFHLHPTSWSETVPGEFVDICFTTRYIKGPMLFPPSFCLSDFDFELPVTGKDMPLIIPSPDVPDLRLMIRVTPVN